MTRHMISTETEVKRAVYLPRYAKRSRQWPFKLPEAPATSDRGKDWDAPEPDPDPYDTRLKFTESHLGALE